MKYHRIDFFLRKIFFIINLYICIIFNVLLLCILCIIVINYSCKLYINFYFSYLGNFIILN